MKEKKINYGLIISLAIIVILFIPIIVDYIKAQKIVVLTKEEINEKIVSKESFLVYVGKPDKDTKKELRTIRDMKTDYYSIPYTVYRVEKMSDIKDIVKNDVKLLLVVEGDIQKEYSKYKYDDLYSDVEEFVVGNISKKDASYKVAENFIAYKDLVNSKDVTVAVFGRESCSYCNKFKVVYNAVAEKYDVDIYYFDSDSYNEEQYKKIINLDLSVPGKCGSTGEDFKLSDGFGTPLTIITKQGKIIDCIGGYVGRDKLLSVLKDNDMISE